MSPSKTSLRHNRKRRIRARVIGTSDRPRLTVTRSLTRMSVQLIDDTVGKTLAAASTIEAKTKLTKDGAKKLGELIAEKAKTKKISTAVFDRNGYKYHGRVKELADAARAAGLQF